MQGGGGQGGEVFQEEAPQVQRPWGVCLSACVRTCLCGSKR